LLGPYLLACLILLIAALFAGSLAPVWFPLQVFRFFSTINFLLCVPVGISLAYLAELYMKKRASWTSKSVSKPSPVKQFIPLAVAAIAVVALTIASSSKRMTNASAFYTAETFPRISSVLQFAQNRACML